VYVEHVKLDLLVKLDIGSRHPPGLDPFVAGEIKPLNMGKRGLTQCGNTEFTMSYEAVDTVIIVHAQSLGDEPGLIITSGAHCLVVDFLQRHHIRIFSGN
jgi:hypothetical protein